MMKHRIKHGRTLATGALVGATAILSLGMAQPANEPTARVLTRLERIERALLVQDSTLPADPARSIEGMLADVLASQLRLEATLADLDEARLEELASRIRFIHDSLLDVKVADVPELARRIREIERQLAGLGATRRIDDLVRQIDDVERDARDLVQRAKDDIRRDLDRTDSEIRRLEGRVRRVESKIK